MAFGAGWDRLHPLTLRFVDAGLERDYQISVLETRRRRQRAATRGGAAIFAALAVLTPPLTGLPTWPLAAILLGLAAANAGASLLIQRCRTTRQLDAIGIGIQLGSGTLILVTTVIVDLFTRYAAPALMAQAVFAFGVSRHPFRNAAVISTGQTVQYLAFGIGLGLAPGILVDAFILAAAVAGASFGTYLAERTDRRLFAQGLVVDDLHRRVNDLFHRYLAPEVADALIADPARANLGGQEVEVSVLFADLTGFTSISERLSPDEAVAMLNRAFGSAVPIVLAEGGTIVQFAGDAMMAIFNAPVPQSDHALRAARAALGLQRATSGRSPQATVPRFRVGINTGPALVGNVGTAELRNFTAIGDATNLAARLQTFAPPGSVVIGSERASCLEQTPRSVRLARPTSRANLCPWMCTSSSRFATAIWHALQ